MVDVKQNLVLISCDCARCPSAEQVESLPRDLEVFLPVVSQGKQIESARRRVEHNGWFIERFPKKIPRDFCPRHADAYRTAFHRLQGAVVFLALLCLSLAACGNVEEVMADPLTRRGQGDASPDAGMVQVNGTGGSVNGQGGSMNGTGGSVNGAGGAQGGGAGGAGGAAPPCYVAVLRVNCSAGCHDEGSANTNANLDLVSGGVQARLVGVPASTSTNSNAACGGKGFLIDRGSYPATGVLIDKINFRGSCGSGMPFAGNRMSPTDVACLQGWADALSLAAGP